MNDRGILTNWEEVKEQGGFDYPFPTYEFTADAKLDFRAWGKRQYLVCYFSNLENDSTIMLNAWRRKFGDTYIYSPQNCSVDFSYVEDGTKWRITVKQNSKGNYTWFDAKPVEE